MSLRISSAVAFLSALAACSSGTSASDEASAAAGQTQQGAAGAVISVPCALAGAKGYTDVCAIERASLDGKVLLTLRHPDGGFRRLIELDGGRRFAAADGSAEVAIEANGQEIEVTLGEDHYLFPAATVPSAPPS